MGECSMRNGTSPLEIERKFLIRYPDIGWLSALVFLLIGFIQAYIMLSFLFPMYYMYGSIEAHEQEKNKFNKEAL